MSTLEANGAVEFADRLKAAVDGREDVTLWGVDYMPALEGSDAAKMDELTRAAMNGEDVDLWGRAYTALPVDADGVPIRVGDVMESKGSGPLFGEASFEVRSMRCDECGWEVYDRLGDRYAPSMLRHHHAPTVEDVLTEFAAKLIERSGLTNGAAQTIAEYAAKLRLAGDE